MSGRYELREKGNPSNFVNEVGAANEADARGALVRKGVSARGESEEVQFELVCYHGTTGVEQSPVDW